MPFISLSTILAPWSNPTQWNLFDGNYLLAFAPISLTLSILSLKPGKGHILVRILSIMSIVINSLILLFILFMAYIYLLLAFGPNPY